MGRLAGMLVALVCYVSVATMLTLGAGFAYLYMNGKLDGRKCAQILALIDGLEPTEKAANATPEAKPIDSEQPSYEEREKLRQMQSRQLELREQSLKSGLERVQFAQKTLSEEKDRYERLKTAFENQLAALGDGAKSAGRENVRLIWENIKPKLAKEQILQMLESQEINEVVAILSSMPIAKRAKIISEFKTPGETAKMDEILRLIRQGVPETNLIDKTRSQVREPQSER